MIWCRRWGTRNLIEGLKLLRQADLVLDTANPRADLIEAVVRVSDRVPGLRIVIDHVPALALNAAVEANLRELASRPSIYFKISQVLGTTQGQLDHLFAIFGADQVIFGSDWPNAEAVDRLPEIVKKMRDYFAGKGRDVAEKYFWKNSVAAYKWKGVVGRSGERRLVGGSSVRRDA